MSLTPGWYDDPATPARWRWFDDGQWTPWVRIDQPPLNERTRFQRPQLGRGWYALATAVQLGLAIYLVLAVFAVVLDFQVWAELGVGEARARDLDSAVIDDAVRIADPLSNAAQVLYLVLAVLFITWLFRAHRSDRMSATALGRSSGWAIGGWLIPFANLVLPALAVHDVNRASRHWNEPTKGWLVTTWWITFVASTILSRAAAVEPDDDLPLREYFGALRDLIGVALVGEALGVVAALLAIAVVRTITSQVRTSPYGPRVSEG